MKQLALRTLCAMIVCSSAASAQGWIKSYGGPGFEFGYAIRPMSDGGFIVGGTQSPEGSNMERFWVARFDSSGNGKWDRSYGRDGLTHTLFSFSTTHDDGFMVGGFTGIQFSGTESALMYRGDSSGNVLWDIDVDYSSSDHWHFGFERREGGYYLGGHTDSKDDPRGDMWLVRYDSARHVIWEKTYDNGSSEHAHTGIETRDGGVLMLGHTTIDQRERFWAVKVDSNGTKQWDKVYASSPDYHDSPYKVFETKEGNYALIGGSSHAQASLGTMWLVVVDSVGKILVDKHFGNPNGESFAWSGRQTSDGGYILAGYTTYQTNGQEDMYVVKTTANGTLEWEKKFGGTDVDYGYDVIETSDGYVACGFTGSPTIMTGGGGDLLLVKIPKTVVAPPLPAAVVLAAPAPAANVTDTAVTLTWHPASPAVTRYQLDLSGDPSFATMTSDSTITDTSALRAGLTDGATYWWRVRASNSVGWGPYGQPRSFTVQKAASVPGEHPLSSRTALFQNIPNPFGTTSTLGFHLASRARVRVTVSDLAGRELATLFHGDADAGDHAARIDAAGLPSGVYIGRLLATYGDGVTESRVICFTVAR